MPVRFSSSRRCAGLCAGRFWAAITLVCGVSLLAVAGCGEGAGPAAGYEHVYTVRGRVLKLPDGLVDDGFYVHHEPIPEYVSMSGKLGMPEMAMAFAVPDPSVLDGLAVGDVVEIEYGETFRPKIKQGVIKITKLPADTVLSFDDEADAEVGDGGDVEGIGGAGAVAED